MTGDALGEGFDRLAERWLGAWVGRGSFADSCTPDVHYEDPVARDPLHGVEALLRQAQELWRAFPDVRVEGAATPLLGHGQGCIPWRAQGTHRGTLKGLPASGRFVVLHGVHYVELSDGLVRRARGFFDLYEAGVQTGLLPGRGGLGERALLLVRGFGLRPRG